MATFDDVIATAQNVYLNDAAGTAYTSARLFLSVKEAYRVLKTELGIGEDQVFKEIQAVTYTAGGLSITNLTALFQPYRLEERPLASTAVSDYRDIVEYRWELGADKDISDNLKYWCWRENEIKVLPANTDRTVRAYFQKSIADPTASSETIGILRAEEYLAPMAAAYASLFIGNNPERAAACNDLAEKALNRLMVLSAKKLQSVPVKRLPYKGKPPYLISS